MKYSYYDIQGGDRVTIRTAQNQLRSGKAVMKGPAGWVLNMGGAHGTPGIATPENTEKVRKTGSSQEIRNAQILSGGIA